MLLSISKILSAGLSVISLLGYKIWLINQILCIFLIFIFLILSTRNSELETTLFNYALFDLIIKFHMIFPSKNKNVSNRPFFSGISMEFTLFQFLSAYADQLELLYNSYTILVLFGIILIRPYLFFG